MVLADSRRVSPAPRYSGYSLASTPSRTGLSPTPVPLSNGPPVGARVDYAVLQPPGRRNAPGLGSSPFARHYLGNSYIGFFSSGYLDVSVPPVGDGCPSTASRQLGCPIRIPADQRLFAAPHSFSQLTTSFIASECPGIHTCALLTFSSRKTLLLCLILVSLCRTSNNSFSPSGAQGPRDGHPVLTINGGHHLK